MSAPSRRAAAADDAVDGVHPGAVETPGTPEALAAVLGEAASRGQSVVLKGGGTKLAWGRPPGPIDLLLETGGLDRVLAHRHGDLTATLQAGARLAHVQRTLAAHQQWLPLDSAFDRATIGGLIATNDSGPLRQRYGTPRDLLIGITLATTAGRLVKSGGQVVKNVAGYDLGKLMSGSHGSLAAIVDATFKLAPRPAASATVTATYAELEPLEAAVRRVQGSQLEPLAFDVHALFGRERTAQLLVRFAATPAAVAQQCTEGARLLAPADVSTTEGSTEAAVWHEQTAMIWSRPGAIARVAWHVSSLGSLLAELHEQARREHACIELSGRAGVGAGFIRLDAAVDVQARVVTALRRATPALGAVSLLRADRSLKARVDVWGSPSSATPALDAIKQALDPQNTLNAGRGPI